jgi:hypothetical protein
MILRLRVERAAVAAMFTAIATAATAQPSLDSLLDALSTYLDTYEMELSTVVAEEQLTQELSRRVNYIQQRRVLISDVTFMRLPGDGPWYGYREVKRVDNRELARSGPGLVELLANPSRSTYEIAIEIADTSAQWNLGSKRTINMPAVPLELAHRRNRARFVYRLRGSDSVHDLRVARVDFEERVTPALIRTLDGRSHLLTKGKLYIEPGSGRLWRVDVEAKALAWKFSVTFRRHDELAMLVPEVAREEFYVPRAQGIGVARYSNFRRFTTSARILPQ